MPIYFSNIAAPELPYAAISLGKGSGFLWLPHAMWIFHKIGDYRESVLFSQTGLIWYSCREMKMAKNHDVWSTGSSGDAQTAPGWFFASPVHTQNISIIPYKEASITGMCNS